MKNAVVSNKILDNYLHPQNCGIIENATLVGSVGDFDTGIKITFYLVINNEMIEDIKFKAFGCITLIASASMLTQMVKGKSINSFSDITADELSMSLGQVPQEKLYCCDCAIKAFKNGISMD